MLKDDQCSTVRQGVCQALRFLFKEGNPHLISKLPEIMDFMLAKCQDPDERVALEACEFWHVFSDYDDHHKQVGGYLPISTTRNAVRTHYYRFVLHGYTVLLYQVHDLLQRYLPRLIPVLLMGMVYSKAEQEVFEVSSLEPNYYHHYSTALPSNR